MSDDPLEKAKEEFLPEKDVGGKAVIYDQATGKPITNYRLPQTANLPKRADPPPPEPGRGPFIKTTGLGVDGRPKMDDRAYVLENGEDRDFSAMREKIEKRIAALPEFEYWVCENPKCRGGWKTNLRTQAPPFRLTRNSGPPTCLKCNPPWAYYHDPKKKMRKMSGKEAEQWEKDVKAEDARAIERARQEQKLADDYLRGKRAAGEG